MFGFIIRSGLTSEPFYFCHRASYGLRCLEGIEVAGCKCISDERNKTLDIVNEWYHWKETVVNFNPQYN